jgi:hypothetical protein
MATRSRPVRRVDKCAIGARILQVEPAIHQAHTRVLAGDKVLRVRQHPVVAGHSSDGAPALIKHLVGGLSEVTALLADDAQSQEHYCPPPAPTQAQFVPAQSPVSMATEPAVSGNPRVHSQLAVTASDPSVHQIAKGARYRLISR